MPGPITRNRIIAYILDIVGFAFVALYIAGHSAKIASTYDTPVVFLYLGVVLLISGTALAVYDVTKAAKSPTKQRDDLK